MKSTPSLRSASLNAHPEIVIELQTSREGCYVRARIEGAPDQLPHTLVAVVESRERTVREATAWAIGWLRVLRHPRHGARL